MNCKAVSTEEEQIQKYEPVCISAFDMLFCLQTCVEVLPAERYPCALQARVRALVAAPLAVQPVPLPVADGVRVLDYKLVHPGEGLREQHVSLEEAQVASMLGQGEYHVGHLL